MSKCLYIGEYSLPSLSDWVNVLLDNYRLRLLLLWFVLNQIDDYSLLGDRIYFKYNGCLLLSVSLNLSLVLLHEVSNSLFNLDNLCNVILDDSIGSVNYLNGFSYFWFLLDNNFLIYNFFRLGNCHCRWELLHVDQLNRFWSLRFIGEFNFFNFVSWINSNYGELFFLHWSSDRFYFLGLEWNNLNNFSYGSPNCWDNFFNLFYGIRSYDFESLFSCSLLKDDWFSVNGLWKGGWSNFLDFSCLDLTNKCISDILVVDLCDSLLSYFLNDHPSWFCFS